MAGIKRTAQEIVKQIELLNDVFFSFSGDLIEYLDFSDAKPLLEDDFVEKVETGEKKWEKQTKSPEDYIKDYMPFAWEKANWCRGLSAARSISHMRNWLWLLGYDDLAKEIENYSYYGKPQLVKICELFGIDWRQYDDGDWRNSEDGEKKTAEQVLGLE